MKQVALLLAAAALSSILCPAPAQARQRDRRLVEEVIIEGNRRLTDGEILARLRTRPGAEFDGKTVRGDLQALLEWGQFDTTQTRVSTEVGARGGLAVIFQVVERPVIRSIAFKGLKSVGEAEALRALADRQDVRREGLYEPAKAAAARRVIVELLAARRRPEASVEVEVEELSSVSVELTFVVKEGPRAPNPRDKGRWF